MPTFRPESRLPILKGNAELDLLELRTAFFNLEEELRYMFNNLDTDNFGEGLSVSINDAVARLSTDMRIELDTAGITSEVIDEINGIASRFEQAADEIIQRVEQKIMENIGYQVQIVSSNGSIFKNGNIETTLSVVLRVAKEDVTADYNEACFRWTRKSADASDDRRWNAINATGMKEINITNRDVNGRATFFCTFTEPVTGVSLITN